MPRAARTTAISPWAWSSPTAPWERVRCGGGTRRRGQGCRARHLGGACVAVVGGAPARSSSVLVPLLPMLVLGYGTDIDTWNVRSSAKAIRAGDYLVSRPPGAPVHEAATAVLDSVGGSVATNLGSLAAAAAILLLLPSLLRRAGARHAELATLAVAANPFFLASATSLTDALWAIVFLLGGIEASQRRRPWLAGTLWLSRSGAAWRRCCSSSLTSWQRP